MILRLFHLGAGLACALGIANASLAQDALAQSRDQPPPAVGKALEKVPQTADEKSKVLNDLYAYLATAANEQEAKPVADAIERLWLQSGSDTISLLMERSAAAVAAKNPELALQLLNAVVALAPDFAEGFNRRAYVNFSQGNLEGAVGDLRRALALEPNHFRALDGLAQIWREHG